MQTRQFLSVLVLLALNCGSDFEARGADNRPKRVLLIGQGPDTHKPSTHEYMAGVRILYAMLHKVEGLQPVIVRADGKWEGGPDLIDSADGAFIFVSQGAKWISDDQARLAAFQRLEKRGGGLACWHWGMGTRTAEPIAAFVELFGGCHGGPDRKHRVMKNIDVGVATPDHPIARKIQPFTITEEFYYALKFGPDPKRVTPLLTISQDGSRHTVGWAWNRPSGGRSFGFSGGHFHDTWQRAEYRRLAAQGVLWVMKLEPPKGLSFDVPDFALKLKPQSANGATPNQSLKKKLKKRTESGNTPPRPGIR